MIVAKIHWIIIAFSLHLVVVATETILGVIFIIRLITGSEAWKKYLILFLGFTAIAQVSRRVHKKVLSYVTREIRREEQMRLTEN
jgi:hypothetical protein